MMQQIDINCDMGEGVGNDALLMPLISSANIACSYHAGDEDTMWHTVQTAMAHKVAIGAHPSYADRENFGRTPIHLPPQHVYTIVAKQVQLLQTICTAAHTTLHHVKPHGALYNTAANDLPTANAIACAVKDCNSKLVLYGLPGTCMEQAAATHGLTFWGEAFADRTYQPNGTLTPRQHANALINNSADAVKQVLQIAQQQTITTITGQVIAANAATICIHGDGTHALDFAKTINAALISANISINKYEHR
jgi:5-oxoprolinase (ATP-hydrolysing) subunit A